VTFAGPITMTFGNNLERHTSLTLTHAAAAINDAIRLTNDGTPAGVALKDIVCLCNDAKIRLTWVADSCHSQLQVLGGPLTSDARGRRRSHDEMEDAMGQDMTAKKYYVSAYAWYHAGKGNRALVLHRDDQCRVFKQTGRDAGAVFTKSVSEIADRPTSECKVCCR
jgi:hypothetical protein